MDIYSSLLSTLFITVLATPALAHPLDNPLLPIEPSNRIMTSTPYSASRELNDTVNINLADAQTLALQLKGIGIKRAKSIIAYREEHGPFQTIDDLAKIKGISIKTIEKNRDRITI